MQRKEILRNVFIGIASLIVVAFLLEVAAMTQFAGGSHIDKTTEGFDFVWNTLTDLGRDPAPNGEPNLTSRILYRIAIFYMFFFGIVYHSIIWKFFTKRQVTKYLSIAGSALGIVQGGLYIGVLFVESHPEHNNLIAAAAGCLVGAVLIYTIVFFLDDQFPKINKWTYFTTFSLAIVYATIIFIGFLIYNANVGENSIFHNWRDLFGISIDTTNIGVIPEFHTRKNLYVGSQRIGHTLFNWSLKISFIIQTIAIYFHLKTTK